MNQKYLKKFIVCVLASIMGCGFLIAEKKSKFSLFVYSGASVPAYPEGFNNFYNSSFNVGTGFGVALSSRLTFQAAANFYCFYPREAYSKYIYFGDSRIELPGKGFYQGDHFFAFYNIFAELKFAMNNRRFSPYLITGAGASVRRRVVGGYIGIDGSYLDIGTSVFYSVEGGIGLEYHIDKEITFFLEAATTYSFFKKEGGNAGVIPLKIGIIHHL